MKNQWLVKPRPIPSADIKLICFTYAGGGVSIYTPWKDKLADNVELNIVQLPGRGTHFSNKLIDDMDELVSALLPKISGLLQHNYVIYGHSLGSRVGFELVRLAMSKGFPAPLHFFASGSASPKSKALGGHLYDLPDEQFIEELKKMNGTPKEILASKELMSLIMPTLRADFKIAEQYVCDRAFSIPTGVTVLGGKQDKISSEKLKLWGEFFSSMEIEMCDGDHFFIDSNPQQVLDIVNRKLTEKASVFA